MSLDTHRPQTETPQIETPSPAAAPLSQADGDISRGQSSSGAGQGAGRSVPSCHADGGGAVAPAGSPVVALAGAPNVGKSSLFNLLTGAKRQMGNWPGTSVEVGRGAWRLGDGGTTVDLVDLPGAYSLDPMSPDEELTRALLVDVPRAERPDLVVVAVDAAHLARSLYLVAQVREYALRVVVALTMVDVAQRRGIRVEADALADHLGCPVVALDPRRRVGRDELAAVVGDTLSGPIPAPRPGAVDCGCAPGCRCGDCGRCGGAGAADVGAGGAGAIGVGSIGFAAAGVGHSGAVDPRDDLALADERFAWLDEAVRAGSVVADLRRTTYSDRIDRVLTSPVWGPLVFLAAMWGVFQITTSVAAPLQDALDGFFTGPVSAAAVWCLERIGLGGTPVHGFVVDGLIAGVGMLLTFAPLMTLMFALLSLLEDSGYMARAAVVADRLMRLIGLPGRAFLPLIVGFGCNVPAIGATRALPNARHRLMTALLVPLTSCSARLTVYVLMASIFFPGHAGLVVFGMYVVSIVLVVALGLALRSTVWRHWGSEPLILDLPPYQLPHLRLMTAQTWLRLKAFLRTASGIIVATVAVVWLLQATPAGTGKGSFGHVEQADSVYAAAAGAVAPAFEPAGFGGWRESSALVVGFVAKEAVISSWAQTYAVAEPDTGAGGGPGRLGELVRADFEASSGGHPDAAALAFMVFLLAYTPCVATLAAQKREIGWRWTAAGVAMQLTMAWALAVLVFQVGRLIT